MLRTLSSVVFYSLISLNSHNNFTGRNYYWYFSDEQINALKDHEDISFIQRYNDLLSPFSVTVLGSGYTAGNQKDMEIIVGGGRNSGIN